MELVILGYLAKYAERYQVKIYAFAIEGSHLHLLALFPKGNRKDFMRDFASQVAKLIRLTYPGAPRGGIFERRYSAELVPFHKDDIEDRYFYTVLQAVQDCLVHKISDYPFYNCFHESANGIKRTIEVTRWAEYNSRKRYNENLTKEDFTDTYILQYERIPGYENLSQKDYANILNQKLEARRSIIVREQLDDGRGFTGPEALRKTVPGTRARNPKVSHRNSRRPRVLSVCPHRHAAQMEIYFDKLHRYEIASAAYRAGDLQVEFPEGMYPPSLCCKFKS
jgi:hypothetical protein